MHSNAICLVNAGFMFRLFVSLFGVCSICCIVKIKKIAAFSVYKNKNYMQLAKQKKIFYFFVVYSLKCSNATTRDPKIEYDPPMSRFSIASRC